MFRTLATAWIVAASLISTRVLAAVHVVPDDFPTIQAAIDAYVYPDTVLVRSGSYAETVRLRGAAPPVLAHPSNAPGDSVHVDRLRIDIGAHEHDGRRGLSIVGLHVRGAVTLETLDTSIPWIEFIACRIDSGMS